MSTPFDLDAVDLLMRVGVDAFKIASGDLTYVSLIRRAAATGKPLVISSGMSSLEEVLAAVRWAREAGAAEIAVLHCVSSYPAPSDSENLAAVRTLSETLDVPVGLSDHGTTPEAAAIAVALGGCIYERHFVGAAESDAIDRAVSSTPRELAAVFASAERTRRALGDGMKICQAAEAGNQHASRRGLYARRGIRRGQTIREDDLVALRPADGIPAEAVDAIVGATAVRDIAVEAAVHWDDLVSEDAGRRARAV
jgi:sialic acid synthase SpsE